MAAGLAAKQARSILPPGMNTRIAAAGCIAMILAGTGGCVERILTVQTNPPGALVYLNGQEMGRTPVQRDFTWYGTYDLSVRKEGYQTIKTGAKVMPPIYEWIPLDLLFEVLPIPLRDHHVLHYDLEPTPIVASPDTGLLERGQSMREQLEWSHYPATRPTTRPEK
jgi:hypothetical protein